MRTSRRTFMLAGLGAATSVLMGKPALAADAPHLRESDADALDQAYKDDATKVDAGRNPAYKTGQTCANCSLYAGDAGAAWGGCPLFGDKLVAAKGWCKSYTNS